MSRRTKLWTLGLTLLLLAGPVTLVVLSWSPENPLRFRAIGNHKLRTYRDQRSVLVLMEIENTSSFPLLLYQAEIRRADTREGNLGLLSPLNQFDPAIRDVGEVIKLEGSQRVRALAVMNRGWNDQAKLGGAKVKYVWFSETESRFARIWLSLRELLPGGLRGFVPQPEEGRDETPLEPLP